ncbi:hypothetical protein [Sporosarcina aquimarina]|uniref:Uncharacterized protein n=1 Tax=Sporosarcina aquimarina TaxID=114975 RepID=A0ABU4FYA2_9BACL|nr:hypothetical protein [Sporosarcina aquimarina]MDW0109695.1 hypothetical protein [Sporosarcina aquimarina]
MNKFKLKPFVAILGCVIILTIGSVILFKLNKNHQANERIIDKCFENFDEQAKVVVVKDSFWSAVSCEKQP